MKRKAFFFRILLPILLLCLLMSGCGKEEKTDTASTPEPVSDIAATPAPVRPLPDFCPWRIPLPMIFSLFLMIKILSLVCGIVNRKRKQRVSVNSL